MMTPCLATITEFDSALGVFTAGPILMFTLYLAMLATEEFLPLFPLRLQRVTKYTLIFFIPIVLVLNALGSFFNLEYSEYSWLPSQSSLTYKCQAVIRQPQGPDPYLEWKYASEQIETFLNTLTLVIFLAFQLLAFVACFLRLTKALLDQRRIDGTANGNDNEAVLFNGLGWNVGGIMLGVIETIIGFVGGSFCMIMTRRMLRLVGRACIIIGAVKGYDIFVSSLL